MVTKRQHFKHFSDDEISKKRRSTIPKVTIKNNDKWDSTFRSYLEESGCENTEYWYFPEPELDDILCHFWFEVRTQ